MTDHHHPPTPPQEPVTPVKAPKDPIIVKAFYGLKIKTGTGGFDAMNVKKAERRLANAAHIFPQVAADDLMLIEEMLERHTSQQQNLQPTSDAATEQEGDCDLHENIVSSLVELKAHSTMFQFPVVTEILDNLLPFCLSLTQLTPLARDVIHEHLRALKVAIAQGPRAITEQDRTELLSGLKQAVAKVLRKQ